MKGFKLSLNEKRLSGAIKEGITSVLITFNDGKFNLNFSSLNQANQSYIWHKTDLKIGDLIDISFEENVDVSEAQEIIDHNISKDESDKRTLDSYHKLRQELIQEGLLTDDGQDLI